MDKKKIGLKIEEGIKRKGINNTNLAKRIGVSSAAVGQWIKGISAPSGEKIIDVIEYLELQEDFFPGYVKEKRQPYVFGATLEYMSREIDLIKDQIDKFKKQE